MFKFHSLSWLLLDFENSQIIKSALFTVPMEVLQATDNKTKTAGWTRSRATMKRKLILQSSVFNYAM